MVLMLSAAWIVAGHRWTEALPAAPSLGSSTVLAADTATPHTGVSAVARFGRIGPQDGVLQVTAAYFEGRPQRVLRIQGKARRPRACAPIACRPGWQGAIADHAAPRRGQSDLARARLTQVKTGARPSDIAAQKSPSQGTPGITRNARAEYHRYEVLHEKTDVSTAELERDAWPSRPPSRSCRRLRNI